MESNSARRLAVILLGLAVAGLLPGCGSPSGPRPVGDGSGISGLPESGAHLSVFPVDTADIVNLTSLGWLSPPGHTFPSDHIYINFKDFTKRHRVIMPVDGYLVWVLHADTVGDGADFKLQFRGTQHFLFYLDHLTEIDTAILNHIPPLHLGGNDVAVKLKAGDGVGWSGSPAKPRISMDLGVICDTVSQPFVVPAHYNYGTQHSDNPLHYYCSPLRESLVSLVFRDGASKEGQVCWDVDGTLAGNWFSQGATDMDWTRELSFVPDPRWPQYPRVCSGGEVSPIGIFALRASAPAFASVTPTSGILRQALLSWDPNLQGRAYDAPVRGWLLTQLLDARTLKVEVHWGGTDSVSGFDSLARIYVR
jgi:hypothetical protein